jgi:hypothetical protein
LCWRPHEGLVRLPWRICFLAATSEPVMQ